MNVITATTAHDVTYDGTEESMLEYIAEIIYDDITVAHRLSIIEVTNEWVEPEMPGEFCHHASVEWEVN